MKKYGKAKVPYFFKYAKDKSNEKVEPITDNTINKIVKAIDDNKQMFNSISKLEKVDYRVLLKDQDSVYMNDEINNTFQKWNRKYGLNLKFDDEHGTLNNKNIIAQDLRKMLLDIEPDEDKIITSLVLYYYSKPSSRKKKLLWYVYGEELFENLRNNVGKRNICHQCGTITTEELIRGKCRSCRIKEAKEKGYKLINCMDCGKEVLLPLTNRRTCRCEECQEKETLNNKRIFKQRYDKLKK